MIGKSGKRLILDPSPSNSMLFCQPWVFMKKSLLDLHWDQLDYIWNYTNPSSHFSIVCEVGTKVALK